jgi:Rha family phage regulatory protein
MKELVPKDSYGLFADGNDTARVDSLFVAKFFNKDHNHVLRDIENLDCSNEFHQSNFGQISYKDTYGRKQKAVAMTKDGFTFLVMGYRGKKAAKFKEMYIRRFNEMEQYIKTLVSARKEFPLLTENIKLLHENPKPYHFSNECDMINRLVIGMSAKQFRQANGIENHGSIRPYLTAEQIKLLDTLQKADVGLLIAEPDFEKRKQYLQDYLLKIRQKTA